MKTTTCLICGGLKAVPSEWVAGSVCRCDCDAIGVGPDSGVGKVWVAPASPRPIPYKCPVCNGTTWVPVGFYSGPVQDGKSTSSVSPEKCRACVNGVIYS